MTSGVQACEGECNALRDECRAISEDLEVLVKENQVVNHQLSTAVTERCATCSLDGFNDICHNAKGYVLFYHTKQE